jgi:hypothetical protein
VAVARRGITNCDTFRRFYDALQCDLVEGLIPFEVGNAICRAGANQLKVTEMEFRYGNMPRRKLEL